MRALHLFSGGGGSNLAGLLLGWESAGSVEYERKYVDILQGNYAPHHKEVIWGDVRTFRPADHDLVGHVDLVAGGFPCTGVSRSGKRTGFSSDSESARWFDMARIIGECDAQIVFAENSPEFLSLRMDATAPEGSAFQQVLSDLARVGFNAVEWGVLSASGVGAPHIRGRLWVLAWKSGRGTALLRSQLGDLARPAEAMVDADSTGRSQQRGTVTTEERFRAFERASWRRAESILGLRSHGLAAALDWPGALGQFAAGYRMAQRPWEPSRTVASSKSVPRRIQQLEVLGNGWVPLQAAFAFLLLAQRAVLLPAQ